MIGITHAAAGAALGAALASFGGQDVPTLAGAIVGAVAALLPDLDHPGSYSGRVFRSLAVWLEEKYGHRDSPTHTLAFCLFTGAVLGALVGCMLGSALLILSGTAGAISHLILDGMTRSGIQPLRLHIPGPPGLSDKAPVVFIRLTQKWKKVKRELEFSTWAQKRWSGPIYTGKDIREFVLAVFCFSIAILIIGIKL